MQNIRFSGSPVLLQNQNPLVIHAVDRDLGLNGFVCYHILSPLEPYFSVDFISGAIRSKISLDFEKVGLKTLI